MKDSGKSFKLGFGCAMALYVIGCIVVAIIGLANGTLSLAVVIGFCFYAVMTSLVLGFSQKLKFGEWGFKVAQCLLFSVLSIFISVAFDSAQTFVYCTFIHLVISFVFIDPKLAKLQLAVCSGMLAMMIVVIALFVRSAQSMIEFIFGTVITFITGWVIIAIVTMIRFQHRQMTEQERSLDDLLKVVEAKCNDARAATRSKTRFLANMSHEIRTPINSVIGMNEMILRESTEPDIKSYATDVNSAAQSLLSIINDILDITKIEEGRIELSPVEYSLQKLIAEVHNLVRFRALSKDLKLEVQADEGLPSVLFGDDMRLKQVLVNLLTNAVKYTHEGSVTFFIERAGADAIRFRVRDTGVGIKPENMDSLFNAFYRVDDQRNRTIEGTGLGLSITQSILERLESRLCVQSVYGKGSEFSFLLKQKVVDATPIGKLSLSLDDDENDANSGFFEAPEAHILVVDDNEMNRRVMRQLLKRTKVDIVEAANGMDAVERSRHQRFDIIFMDHMMPGIDGIEAMHRIRDDISNPCFDVPIVALTANAVIGAKEMYFNEGFDAFLAKPVDSRRLEQLVRVLLDERLVRRVEAADVAEPKQKERKETIELPTVFGVDWAYARAKLPTDELVLDTVKMFGKGAQNELNELSGFFEGIATDEGLDSYRIKVHSMKSSALLIGAVQAGGMAMRLEAAARAGERAVITAMHPIFAQCWMELAAALKPLCDSGRERLPAAQHSEEIAEIYSEIRLAAEDMDVDRLDALSERLDGYQFDGAEAERAESVKAMILGFEIEKLMEI